MKNEEVKEINSPELNYKEFGRSSTSSSSSSDDEHPRLLTPSPFSSILTSAPKESRDTTCLLSESRSMS
uniref:Uncharacterized protein n=1 Tax=Lepeophtheirus salmonis TaxID=72036 RepID=A0A0K2UPY4_LEPSM